MLCLQARISATLSNFAFSQELDAPYSSVESSAIAVLAERWRLRNDNLSKKDPCSEGIIEVDRHYARPTHIWLDNQVGVVGMV